MPRACTAATSPTPNSSAIIPKPGIYVLADNGPTMEHVANKNANDFGTLKSIIKPPL